MATQTETRIVSLRPNVTEAEAVRTFSAASLSALFWRLGKGPFKRIAAAYVPFSLYQVSYDMNRKQHLRFFALDQAQGVLDLFEFPAMLTAGEFTHIQTRNQLAPALTADNSELLLREKVLRLIFQQGFFRLGKPNLQVLANPVNFNIPYWLGFYGEDGQLRCRVLDAVRRRMEGAKAAQLFENWLSK